MRPMSNTYAKELEVAERAAISAGEKVLEIYATDFSIRYKDQSQPVTHADELASHAIVSALKEAFPADRIVSEEEAETHSALQSSSKGQATGSRVWFVDPLDGTKEFIAKNGEFSIMIGLAIDGVATLGVVFQPTTSTLYSGVVGIAAFQVDVRNGKAERRTALQCRASDANALVLVSSRSHRGKEMDDLVHALPIAQELASGSVGLKVALIARGLADIYVHMSNRSSKWDACAPDAILHAAGGTFTDVLGRRFDYLNDPIQNTGGIFACTQNARARSAEAVAALAQSSGIAPSRSEEARR